MRDYTVNTEEEGVRLDLIVTRMYPGHTRSSMEQLFENGMVKINKKAVKPAYRVRQGDRVTVDETFLKYQPKVIKLPILYEDDNVIVINKPAGILTHPKGALNLEASVASFIKPKITDDNLVGNRAGIVHRLDRGTSGVIITAKNSASQRWLQKQFSQRKVKKLYLAIAEDIIDPKEAIIDAPVARNPKKPQTFKVMAEGKPAQTRYKVTDELKINGKNYSELELSPQTGRTHQLRVHLAYIGHPIVGDPVYGHNSRQILLHAESLEVTLPNKERKIFKAPIPHSFKEFLNE